jgi:hypothetical protein
MTGGKNRAVIDPAPIRPEDSPLKYTSRSKGVFQP